MDQNVAVRRALRATVILALVSVYHKALRDVFLVLHTFIFSMKSFQTNYKCPIISNFQHAAMIYASGIND